MATSVVPRWPQRQATEAALRAVEETLAGAPGTAAELFYRACLLDRLGRTPEARQAYFDVLARDMGHAGALANLGALLLANGYKRAALTTYSQAAAAHPADPAARVNLGNLLREAQRPAEAAAHYQAALAIDPAYPEAHQGLAYLLEGVDAAAAARHRDLGFANRPITTAPYRGEAPPVTVLQLVSARGNNIPLRAILDDQTFLTHTAFAEYASAEALPPHDLVVNAIGDADFGPAALQAAGRLAAHSGAPVINPPERVIPTDRLSNLQRLGELPGVVAPLAALVAKAELVAGPPPGFGFPFLLRSPGFHTGQHFRRVTNVAELADAASLPGDLLLALQYLDAAGADGCARKYRVMLIDGQPYPLHLAISSDWKVHYYTADMTARAWHREEEARFLADMPATIGATALAALAAIAAAMGLDYAGVDFALAPDGRLLLFEANATMALVPPSANPVFSYRKPAFDRALAAVRAMLLARARRP